MPPAHSPLTVEDWSSLQARLLWCYQGDVAPSHRDIQAQGRHLAAWLILAGSVRVKSRDEDILATAGNWILSGPDARRQHFTADARLLSVNFRLEWPSGDPLVAPFRTLSASVYPGLARAARPLAALLRREFPGVRSDLLGYPADPRVFFRLQQRFAAWVSAYLEAVLDAGETVSRMTGVDPRIRAALRLLDRHPWDVRFAENDLAEKVGLSSGHLDRMFVRQMGTTPRGYLQKRRLETAFGLLREPHKPIKEVAYELGFSSPAHFCHWFRQAAGRSPREFRAGG